MAKKSGIEIRQRDRMRFNKKMRKLSKFGKLGGGFDKELAIYTTDIMLRSSLKVPVDTGSLKQSVFIEKKPFNYTVGYNIDYATFVEYGITSPYKIKVKNKKVLYNRKTNTFFGKEVTMPPRRANPFFRTAISEATSAFIKRLKKQINKETRIWKMQVTL